MRLEVQLYYFSILNLFIYFKTLTIEFILNSLLKEKFIDFSIFSLENNAQVCIETCTTKRIVGNNIEK